MKAVIISQYGTSKVLEAKEVKKPEPGPEQVLVEIHAVSLNPVDFKIREGHLKELFPITFPRILGGDISGVVTGLGAGATDFKIGDEVYFSNPLDKDGGYAEFVAVDQNYVAKKPASLNYLEASSLPVVGLTSVQALRDFGRMKRGSKVLIHAGAGGVGSFAIQYAKVMGATVYTTGSAARKEYLQSLGADRVIDYNTEDFVQVAQEAGGMDIVLDTLGGANFSKSILATRPGGAVPSIVNPPDAETQALAKSRGVKADFFLLSGNRTHLNEIAQLVEKKMIRTTITKTLTLDEIQAGHEQLESGRTQGKIVVKIR